MSRVHFQVLTKKLCGDLVSKLMQERDYNEIMIGINPFSEWQNVYDKLKPYNETIWAGDIGKYDKKMLSQVQQAVSEVLVNKFRGDKNLLESVMGCHTYSLVAVNDDTFLNTHSLPSGSYLTAVMNSLVNRFYKAMWYYRNVPHAIPINFQKDIVDMVYGDDTVNALKNPKLKQFLNAQTMCSFFNSLGMDFTTSTKGKIEQPFESIHDITFLKRKFIFHPLIGKIVCPLDLRTVYSGLSWYDKKTDLEQVLQDKIHNFQREIFLHHSLYKNDVLKLRERCRETGVSFSLLSTNYLTALYKANLYDPEYNEKFLL